LSNDTKIDFARTRIFVDDGQFNNLIGLLVKDNPQIKEPLSHYGVPLPRIYFYDSAKGRRIVSADMDRLLTDPLAEMEKLFDEGTFSTIFIRIPFNIPGYEKPFNLEIELFPESVEKNVHLVKNRYVKQRSFTDKTA
jgi:hypothetical protein